MFTTKSGEKIFVVDGHVHLWDGSDENIKNRYGEEFIKCFYDYHKLSPKEYVWPYKKYQKYTDEDFEQDIFQNGYVDFGISILSTSAIFTTMGSRAWNETRPSGKSIRTESSPTGSGIRATKRLVSNNWRKMWRSTAGKA